MERLRWMRNVDAKGGGESPAQFPKTLPTKHPPTHKASPAKSRHTKTHLQQHKDEQVRQPLLGGEAALVTSLGRLEGAEHLVGRVGKAGQVHELLGEPEEHEQAEEEEEGEDGDPLFGGVQGRGGGEKGLQLGCGLCKGCVDLLVVAEEIGHIGLHARRKGLQVERLCHRLEWRVRVFRVVSRKARGASHKLKNSTQESSNVESQEFKMQLGFED